MRLRARKKETFENEMNINVKGTKNILQMLFGIVLGPMTFRNNT